MSGMLIQKEKTILWMIIQYRFIDQGNASTNWYLQPLNVIAKDYFICQGYNHLFWTCCYRKQLCEGGVSCTSWQRCCLGSLCYPTSKAIFPKLCYLIPLPGPQSIPGIHISLLGIMPHHCIQWSTLQKTFRLYKYRHIF